LPVVVALMLVIGGLCVVKLTIPHRWEILPYENGPSANVSWMAEGTPGDIVCQVTDTNSRPLEGGKLHFDNMLGGNSATTDQSGRVSVHVNERILYAIEVNGKDVLNRPNAGRWGYPNVTNGLSIRIVIKNKRAFEIPP